MSLWQSPVRDVRPLVAEQRASLIRLLDDLTADEWMAPSSAPGWTVKDVALHLLDDDLGWLSRRRDGDHRGLLDMSDRRAFVVMLAEKNQRWVDGAFGLSRRVVGDLLAWSGGQIDDFHATQDLLGEGWVSWASDDAVPYWFNLAQEFTEGWVHQQQIREAVGRLNDHDRLLPEVLKTFVWAFPHQVRVPMPAGYAVAIDIRGVGLWTLVSDGAGRWSLSEPQEQAGAPATLDMTPSAAWRTLTGAAVPDGELFATGPEALTAALTQVRGIIV